MVYPAGQPVFNQGGRAHSNPWESLFESLEHENDMEYEGKGVHEVHGKKNFHQNKNSKWKEIHANYFPEGIEAQRKKYIHSRCLEEIKRQ